jgi:preprotein translocase subunit SecG
VVVVVVVVLVLVVVVLVSTSRRGGCVRGEGGVVGMEVVDAGR